MQDLMNYCNFNKFFDESDSFICCLSTLMDEAIKIHFYLKRMSSDKNSSHQSVQFYFLLFTAFISIFQSDTSKAGLYKSSNSLN